MFDRRHRGLVAAVAGVVLAVAGTFLPWVHSGSRARSSYEIFDLVDRLGFAPNGAVAASLRLWALVPLVSVATAVAAWAVVADRVPFRLFGALSVIAVVWIGGTSLAVLAAPDGGVLRPGVGPWVSLAGTAALVVAVSLISRRGSGSSAAS